uniref:CUB domain-containing protein n=1 Tax=Panagrolaimus sp. PS1159 TaxID=55785 RepID=A0AC35GFT4_9BILA
MSSRFIVSFLFIIFNTVNGYDQIVECSETNTPKNPTDNIWILMLNGVISEMQFYDTHNKTNQLTTRGGYNSNFDIVNFTTSGNGLAVKAFSYESETAWAAFQAIVISYPQNFQGCPLENKTFDFSIDKKSVIPVTPTFQLPDLELSYKLCNWFFTIAPDQQLKVVLRKIEFSENDNITVILSNEKGQIHSFSDTDLDQVFYFDGQNFKIIYEFDYASFSNTGFLIFVSAVTKSISYTPNGCQPPYVNMTTQITTYSNIDYIKGYPPYQKCQSALTIPANHEARLSITEYDYEGISDKLTIDFGESSTTLITWTSNKQPISYKLTSDISGGQLTFNSDGNTEGAGYRADLELTANSTCPDFYFNIKVKNYLRKSIDYLIIYDNQKILENITADSGDSENYFSPNSNVTIQFRSGPSKPISEEDQNWYIQIKPMSTPNFTKIILNKTNTKYVKWLADMKSNDALEVCSSTGTLEIFIPQLVHFYDLREFFLYDSNDLNNYVGSLNSIAETAAPNDTFPLSLKSTSKCFTLFLQDDFPFGKDYTIFFKNDDDSNKNCADSNTVFQIPPPSMPNMNVTIESTNSGSCEMIILTSDYNSTLLSRIWISDISVSDNEGQYSVNSAENGKELFSFKGSDAARWINFGVYTPALSIIAPPSASITISMSGDFQGKTC